MGQAIYTRDDGGLVGGSKRPWQWRGCGANGAGSQGVAVPQRLVQILTKLAKRFQVMGVALAAGGGGRFMFMLRSATSHFSLLGHLKWQAEKRRTARNI
jgi:hypothetical protein